MKRTYAIPLFFFLSVVLCFGNLVGERTKELLPLPFKVDVSFKNALIDQTGYDEILITRIGIFDTENHIYCYFLSSSMLETDDCVYYGHDAFLAKRWKNEESWDTAEFFFMPSDKIENIHGTLSDNDIVLLVEKYGTKVTTSETLKRLKLLKGE
jgi:hypothetical protein